MMKLALSAAAAGLLRALLARAGVSRDRIFLTKFRSVDWKSLAFSGERHEINFRVPGPDPRPVLDLLLHGLEEAEFAVPGQVVADVSIAQKPRRHPDGSASIRIEALTIAE
jgi:hypothetical protein